MALDRRHLGDQPVVSPDTCHREVDLDRKRTGAAAARRWPAYVLFWRVASRWPRAAPPPRRSWRKVDGWEVFTDGRAGGFVSCAYGDGYPQSDYGRRCERKLPPQSTQPQEGGGFCSVSDQGLVRIRRIRADPDRRPGQDQPVARAQRLHQQRVRLRRAQPVTEYTTVTAYVQFWAFVENDGRQKNLPNYPDARQGYAKLEGPVGQPHGRSHAGAVLARRDRHRRDVRAPLGRRLAGEPRQQRPHAGQIGFGVLGSGFSSGLIYGTPTCSGLAAERRRSSIRSSCQGSGAWTRTQYPRARGGADLRANVRQRLGQGRAVRERRVPEGLQGRSCAPVMRSRDDEAHPLRRDGRWASATAAASSSARSPRRGRDTTARGWGSTTRWRSATPRRTRRATCARSDGYYVQTQVVAREGRPVRRLGHRAGVPDRLRQEAQDAGPARSDRPDDAGLPVQRHQGPDRHQRRHRLQRDAEPALRPRLLPRPGRLVRGQRAVRRLHRSRSSGSATAA